MLKITKTLNKKVMVTLAGGLMVLGILVIQIGQSRPAKAEFSPSLTEPKIIKSQSPQILASTVYNTSAPPNSRSNNVSTSQLAPHQSATSSTTQSSNSPTCLANDACATQPDTPSDELNAKQGITGQITIGPVAPVCYVDLPQTCADAPYQTTMVVKNSAGTEVTRFSSKADGSFKVSLPAGTYSVESITQGLPLNRFAHNFSQIVNVEPGKYTHLDISFDSGIR